MQAYLRANASFVDSHAPLHVADKHPHPRCARVQPDKWHKLATASANPHLTTLWEHYSSDCQRRHAAAMPYAAFIDVARELTHPELPFYWTMYSANCKQNEREPDPFLLFVSDMQKALTSESHRSGNQAMR